MATFAFKALDLAGAATQGRDRGRATSRPSPRSCARKRADRRRHRGAGAGQTPATSSRASRRSRRTSSSIATRQLSTMVSSGMSLLRALYVIEEQTENDKLARRPRRGPQGRGGRPRALRRARGATPTSSTTSTSRWSRPARRAASWTRRSMRVADQLEKDAALRRQIKAAMIYPSLIGGFAFVVAVRARRLPRAGVREDLQGLRRRAAGRSRSSRSASRTSFTQQLVRAVRGRSSAVVWVFRRWKNTERGREQWDRLKLKFPMKIGDIVQKVALARFSRTFSALIAAGVPMLEAIEITGKTSGNKVVEKAMDDVRESVKKGGSLAAPMRTCPRRSRSMVTQMIGVGEETGALEAMMSQDRRLLRGAGRGRRQGAHLDPRADHDHRRRRHRRVHRDRDVPADVQGLRPIK